MHATWGPIRISQTTNSLIVHLRKGCPITCWTTASANPCLSIFKPVFLSPLPYDVSPPSSTTNNAVHYTSSSHWWRWETFNRIVLTLLAVTSRSSFESVFRIIEQERLAIETRLLSDLHELESKENGVVEMNHLLEFSRRSFIESEAIRKRWTQTCLASTYQLPFLRRVIALPFLFQSLFRNQDAQITDVIKQIVTQQARETNKVKQCHE